jgi:hypothetical protein
MSEDLSPSLPAPRTLSVQGARLAKLEKDGRRNRVGDVPDAETLSLVAPLPSRNRFLRSSAVCNTLPMRRSVQRQETDCGDVGLRPPAAKQHGSGPRQMVGKLLFA